MTDIRVQNGKKMKKILDLAGPAGATIKKKGEWDLAVYITEKGQDFILVEMSSQKLLYGDLIMDPFMRILLETDPQGMIIRAIPKFYQSDNLFLGRMEIREKGEVFINGKLVETEEGALDQRLENWLNTIEHWTGHLMPPHEIVFHKL